ncbi:MAG: hypothetical protein NTY80_04045 [candidate division SR1 bacterium]|nr:hypothetical protein [candidate division SR1 bacterium]
MKEKEPICFDEMDFFVSEMIKNSKDIKKSIYKTLNTTAEKKNIVDMFKKEYHEAFAIYYKPEGANNSAKGRQRSHEGCLGYSYGDKYNRSSEKDSLYPKTFFWEKENELFECQFFGKNIVMFPVKEKSLGRDSYYPNNYKYVTEFDANAVFKRILQQGTYNIFLGTSLRYDTNIGLKEAVKIGNEFEGTTHFKQPYAYYPIKEINPEDIINDTLSANEIIKEYTEGKNTLLSLSNREEVRKIRKRGLENK